MYRIIELQNENVTLMLEMTKLKARNILLEKSLKTNIDISDNRLELSDSYKECMDSLEDDIKFYKDLLKKSMEQTNNSLKIADELSTEIPKLKAIITKLQNK